MLNNVLHLFFGNYAVSILVIGLEDSIEIFIRYLGILSKSLEEVLHVVAALSLAQGAIAILVVFRPYLSCNFFRSQLLWNSFKSACHSNNMFHFFFGNYTIAVFIIDNEDFIEFFFRYLRILSKSFHEVLHVIATLSLAQGTIAILVILTPNLSSDFFGSELLRNSLFSASHLNDMLHFSFSNYPVAVLVVSREYFVEFFLGNLWLLTKSAQEFIYVVAALSLV